MFLVDASDSGTLGLLMSSGPVIGPGSQERIMNYAHKIAFDTSYVQSRVTKENGKIRQNFALGFKLPEKSIMIRA